MVTNKVAFIFCVCTSQYLHGPVSSGILICFQLKGERFQASINLTIVNLSVIITFPSGKTNPIMKMKTLRLLREWGCCDFRLVIMNVLIGNVKFDLKSMYPMNNIGGLTSDTTFLHTRVAVRNQVIECNERC